MQPRWLDALRRAMAGETWLNAAGDVIINADGDEVVCDDCPCIPASITVTWYDIDLCNQCRGNEQWTIFTGFDFTRTLAYWETDPVTGHLKFRRINAPSGSGVQYRLYGKQGCTSLWTLHPMNLDDQYVHLSPDLQTIHYASWRVWYNVIHRQAGVFFSDAATPVANPVSNQIDTCTSTAYLAPTAGAGGFMTVDQINLS
jgi:hypothetical protein